MKQLNVWLIIAVVASVLICPVKSIYGETPRVSDSSLLVSVSLITGFPSDLPDSSNGVLVVPGVLIPVDMGETLVRDNLDSYLKTYHTVLEEVSTGLRTTLRLEETRVEYTRLKHLFLNEAKSVESPALAITMHLKLMGFNDKLATFHAEFREDDLVVVDTSFSVKLGQRSVIGGMNGDEAPYYFLVVEPMVIPPKSLLGDDQVTIPKLIKPVQPVYPEDCRKEKIHGAVILESRIGEDGSVKGVTALESPDPRLSAAGIEAAKQWLFEPSMLDGKPVEVFMVFTVKFKLE